MDSAAAALRVPDIPRKTGALLDGEVVKPFDLFVRRPAEAMASFGWVQTEHNKNEAAQAGKRRRVRDTLPRSHPGKSGFCMARSRNPHRPSRPQLLLHPKQGYPTFSSCFQVKITFLSTTLQGWDKRDLVTSQQRSELQGKKYLNWELGPLGMPQHSWRNLPALNCWKPGRTPCTDGGNIPVSLYPVFL